MSLAVTPPSHFKHLHTGEGGIGADSVTRLDLARTTTLRYLEYSASRQSSLPINRMTVTRLQQTIYCTKVGHTRSTRFCFAFHKLPKRYMKAQQLVQCMVPRVCCLGASGIHQTNSMYSSDSQLLLCRPSVSGAYLRSIQEKQLLGYQYVAAVFFISESAVLFPVCSS